ncbi:MAG: hypothetical protein ACFFAZ_16830, partial [Promethearchaeota archaeon]
KNMTDELLIHQISMLEGYKSSVSEGAQKILEKMSPDSLKEELSAQKAGEGMMNFMHKLLPFVSSLKLAQLFTDAQRELTQEDKGIIEKKYFRPSYIKSYNRRTDSAKKPKGEE